MSYELLLSSGNVEMFEDLDKLLTEKTNAGQFSGVVKISNNTESLFEHAYGYANRPWLRLNNTKTRFRIGSIGKMFTAVAILQLIDQGKIGFDTNVVEYLDLHDTAIPSEVTVFHLLTMTSGIADWFDESGDWEANWAKLLREFPIYLLRDNRDYLPLFVHEKPVSQIDNSYHYNGAGYILLGLVIERASDQPYTGYVCQHVFERARMKHSDFLSLDGVYPDVAEGYMRVESEDGKLAEWKMNYYSTTPNAAADGGVTSNAEDLGWFSEALRDGNLLSTAMTKEMLTPKVEQFNTPKRGYHWWYGYGISFILNDDHIVVRYGHTGEEDGVSSRLYYYPQFDLDVIILANQSWCAGEIGWLIHDLIVHNNSEQPIERT